MLTMLLLACTSTIKVDDTSDSRDTDTAPPPECNTENEDCDVGTCEGEGDNMTPGADCLLCHSRGGDREAPDWSVGGTLYADMYGNDGVKDATITISDSTGKTVELTTARSGNFHTDEKLTPPLSAMVTFEGRSLEMSDSVETGACNSCHKCDGEANGKLYAP